MTRSIRLLAPLAFLFSATALAQGTLAPGPTDGPDDLKASPARQPMGVLSVAPAPMPAASGIPEASIRAMLNRPVVLGLRSGAYIGGTVVAVDSSTLTVIVDATGQVVSVPRSDVTDLHAVAAPPVQRRDREFAPDNEIPGSVVDEKRHFGLQFSAAPGLMVDLQYGHFYGFANGSVVLPMASAGGILGFGVGLGASWVVGRAQRWHLELYASVTPASVASNSGNSSCDACNFVGVGAGVGMHYTWASGLTIGWKLPVLGYAWVQHQSNSSQFGGSRSQSEIAGTAVGLYYLSSLMGLPIFSFGYRF